MKKLKFDENDVWNSQIEPTSALNLFQCNTNSEGYFSNKSDFSEYSKGKLTGIDIFSGGLNYVRDSGTGYDYFILADKVEEIEKPEYRPFNCMGEMPFSVGDTIQLRVKDSTDDIRFRIITGINTELNGKIKYISFGDISFTTKNLVESYEYFDKNSMTWLPFGVEN